MQVIMGGSGSTGSSLLKNILNRHQEIFSGGETAFFAKKLIYKDWKKAKNKILKRRFQGLRNYGWHIYNGTDLLQQEYLWEREELRNMANESTSLIEFSSTFYHRPLHQKSASIWLEKTPANASCFSSFLNSFEDGKVIHMVRNPYDTIASLMNRGYNLYYAVGIYLCNTACGLMTNDSHRSITVKYENLIQNSEETVRSICSFLEVKYNSDMLVPQGEVVHLPKLEGWNYDETKEIGKKAVGRFNRLSDDAQNEIMEAVNMIKFTEAGLGYYATKYRDIEEISQALGYDFYKISQRSSFQKIKSMKKKDRLQRIKRGYPTGFYYPLEIG